MEVYIRFRENPSRASRTDTYRRTDGHDLSKYQFVPQKKTRCDFHYKNHRWILFREIITVCSGNHTQPTHTRYVQNAEFCNFKQVVQYNDHRIFMV